MFDLSSCFLNERNESAKDWEITSGGEWQARKHSVQGRRQWHTVHLAMDLATSDIRAVEFTPSRGGDSPVLRDLLGQFPADERIGTVTADDAYDTRHDAATAPSSHMTRFRSSRSAGTGGYGRNTARPRTAKAKTRSAIAASKKPGLGT